MNPQNAGFFSTLFSAPHTQTVSLTDHLTVPGAPGRSARGQAGGDLHGLTLRHGHGAHGVHLAVGGGAGRVQRLGGEGRAETHVRTRTAGGKETHPRNAPNRIESNRPGAGGFTYLRFPQNQIRQD